MPGKTQKSVRTKTNEFEKLLSRVVDELLNKLQENEKDNRVWSASDRDLVVAVFISFCDRRSKNKFEFEEFFDAIKNGEKKISDIPSKDLRLKLLGKNAGEGSNNIRKDRVEAVLRLSGEVLQESLQILDYATDVGGEGSASSGAVVYAPMDSKGLSPVVERFCSISPLYASAVMDLHKCLEEWPDLEKKIVGLKSLKPHVIEFFVEHKDLFSLLEEFFYKKVCECLMAELKKRRDESKFDEFWALAKKMLGHLCLLELNPDRLPEFNRVAESGVPVLEVSVQTRFGVEVVRAGLWKGTARFPDLGDRTDPKGEDALVFESDADEYGMNDEDAVEDVLELVWKTVRRADCLSDDDLPLSENRRKLKQLNESLRSDRGRPPPKFHHVPIHFKKDASSPLARAAVRRRIADLLPQLPVIVWGMAPAEDELPVFKGDEDRTMEAVARFLLLKSDLLKSRDAP